ncbi:MAG: glutamate--cysteine ligase [Actinomycetota bacterium]|nr:glutamate--cysteine ligase [Actinomycetota bacterium]
MSAFTVGVEEEFHVLDAATGELRSGAPEVLAALSGGLSDQVEPELLRTQLETGSRVCSSLDDLRTGLLRLRRDLSAAAAKVGCRIAASGTWPAATAQVAPTRTDRYEELAETFGPATHRPVCGCHIHVQVDDPDLRVAAIRRSRPWQPALLALSANSPFWRGMDTGYASYRSQVWARWPTAGAAPALASWTEYDALVTALLATGVLRDKAMLYWDARPSERYDTVEFRVPDVCLRVDDALLLAALARGLTRTSVAAEQAGRRCDDTPAELLRAAHWRAARYGLDGDLVDPLTGRPAPARDVVQGLVEHVRPALEEDGDAEFVDAALAGVLGRGSGVTRQRAAYRARGAVDDVTSMLADETELGS